MMNRQSWGTARLGSPFYIAILSCLMALSCYLSAKLGWALMIRPQMLWPIWPGCAFLVAVLLAVPRRIWPLLIAAGLSGFVVYDVQVGLSLRSTAYLILADTAEILIAALGVSYSFDGLPRLSSVKSLVKYSLFAVILAPLAAAFIATFAFAPNYWIRLRIGFFTEALALLTLTPAILGWVSMGRRAWLQKSLAFYLEAVALTAGLSVLGYVIFVAAGDSSSPATFYSLLPFLLWSALRFGSTGISTAMIVVAFLSIWGAVHGRGPFAGGGPLDNVMSLQLFLFLTATPFMLLAALVEEQRETERAYRESEKRFRLMADTAPVLIWMAETDKLCTYFNKAWLDFTGRSLNLERGNGWAEGVHSEDVRRCLDTYTQAFDRREEFRMEYRLRRHDGEYRWVLDIGVPRFDQDHSFIGYIGIGVDVTERKQAEEALRESEERFRLAAQAGKMFAYEWDAATDLLVRSAESAQILRIDEAAPVTGQQILAKVHPDDRERLLAAVAALRAERPDLQVSYRMVRPDGSVVWVERTSRAHFDEQGKLLRIVGMVGDITDRKRSEEALRKSEERFRLAAQAGKMFAYEWDAATDVLVRSGECVEMREAGKVAQATTGQQILAKVYPDDREKLLAADAALSAEKPYLQVSHRMVGPDGSLIWMERIGRGHFDEQGKLLRIVGMVVDITDRKRAEEVLSSMSRRLIDAQEQERTRIARELHDDIGQRLALLANELEQLQHSSPDPGHEIGSRIRELQQKTFQIAADVQSMSHELHSSKLEYLGIAAAMRGFCQEFGGQHKVKIDFKSHQVPSSLPSDISLCLFRVLQEALRNSLKHSGANQFKAELWGTPDEIHLAVSDSGSGFDTEAARESPGLGLISMQERLKLMKGTFVMESQPMRGTTIHVCVPLSSESDSLLAAG
jgi:PAS domain S-box-containing protein